MRYFDKLKDPRWQRLRLQVFERDGFACIACGNKDRTLHVHHMVYNKNPWDANLDDLTTLCEQCHEGLEEAIKITREDAHNSGLKFIIARTAMLYEIGGHKLVSELLQHSIALCESRGTSSN